jgi:predicted nucleic acid-binding protein
MTRVVDASVIVAALVGVDARSAWAESQIVGDTLVAPHLLPAEVASTLRRSVAAQLIPQEVAALALDDLADLPITYFAAEPLLPRIWALRDNLSAYDAWYVGLAETLDAPLATLDARLAAAPGPDCLFLTPD